MPYEWNRFELSVFNNSFETNICKLFEYALLNWLLSMFMCMFSFILENLAYTTMCINYNVGLSVANNTDKETKKKNTQRIRIYVPLSVNTNEGQSEP